MVEKKRHTLGFKLSVVILIFLLIVLGSCGVLTYFNQMNSYRRQCESNLRDAGEYLEMLVTQDEADFARYQAYFLSHYAEVNIPADAREYVSYRTSFERLFHTQYPGKTLGVDIEFDELNDEVSHAYLMYRQLYWLQTFEEIRESFGLAYTYYILPDSETESDIYIIDGTYPSRAEHIALMAEYPEEYPAAFDHPQGDEAEYLYLGDQVPNARSDFELKWSIWNSGKQQTGFQTWDNEYGKTYAYYTPVVINGQRLGLIGTEIDIESVNTTILHNTLRQFLVIGSIFVGATLLLMLFFTRRFVRKVSDLEWRVRDFSKTKKVSVAEEIRQNIRGKDEISSLSEEVALMIEEIHSYIVTQDEMRQHLEEKEKENEKLISATEYDELTGLYSNNFFLEFALRYFNEHPHEPADSIAVNIDQFHSVNELNGREFGDRVLRALGEEILTFLNENKGIGTRRDVDEFLMLCPPQADYQALLDRFQRRVNQLSDSASIRLRMGVMPWKEGLEPVQLMDRAHTASSRVRGSEKHVIIYDEEMLEREHLNERLLNDLDRALRDHEFKVYYQPKFDVTAEQPILSSAEALVRWQHPELGMVPPGMFIPLFEENALIQQLDAYVWREVAKQMAAWREKYGRVFPVSVNVSRIDLFDPDLIETLIGLVKEFKIRHEDFLLEITESAYAEDSEQIIENVKKLRDAGFMIEMDDFGSGYSSLNMISTLPIDVIKLDMQFIRNAFKGQSDTRMLEAVLGIADMLYLPTVAEGVETMEQMNVLRGMGCDVIQGYYFSKPIPPQEYERFIEKRLSVSEEIGSAEHSYHGLRLSYEDYSFDEPHDPLTGQYNLTAFHMLAKDADQYHTALLLAEITDAKRLLAEQGQAAYEWTLKRVADVLKRSFRPVDHICRISNAQFAIVMSRVDSGIQDQVKEKIDHINEILKKPGGHQPSLSLAVGVAFADRANPGNSIQEDAEAALRGLRERGESGCAFH